MFDLDNWSLPALIVGFIVSLGIFALFLYGFGISLDSYICSTSIIH